MNFKYKIGTILQNCNGYELLLIYNIGQYYTEYNAGHYCLLGSFRQQTYKMRMPVYPFYNVIQLGSSYRGRMDAAVLDCGQYFPL